MNKPLRLRLFANRRLPVRKICFPIFLVTLTSASAQTSPAGSSPAGEPKTDEVVTLSPFEVSAGEMTGYYASNTLSGTRLNTKIEDLAASITVVTKQQMEDFALRDINDVFLYEANTEGTGNYTAFTVDRNGVVSDGTTGGNGLTNGPQGAAGANRIRGIGPANIAVDNFATSGRVPLDSFNLDSVEISRGPNSNIFGLGNASGTVNMIPIKAEPQKRKSRVEVQADSYGGWRTALDHNQPIIPGKLAVRGTFIDQNEGFERDPSFNRTKRYNGMITYQPFKGTILRASFQHYDNEAQLPNNVLPRDGVTNWLANGSPTYDPLTSTAFVPGLSNGAQTGYSFDHPKFFVNPDGSVGIFMAGRQSKDATPFAITGYTFAQSGIWPRTGLDQVDRSLTDQSIYDWTRYNLAGANRFAERNNTFTATLEQTFIDTPRNLLALQAGYYHENDARHRRDAVGHSSDSPMWLFIDVNERLLDGTPNPYFLRPYVESRKVYNYEQPLENDLYRAQLAYEFKLANEPGWLHWVGDHLFNVYAEYNRTFSGNYSYRDGIVSNNGTWPAADADNANNTTLDYRYYVGDNQGNNVDYGFGNANSLGTQTFRWYNGATKQWVSEPVTLGEVYYPAQSTRNDSLLKTFGAVWQAHLLGDRVVGTVGIREDYSYNRVATPPLESDNITRDSSHDHDWTGVPWLESSGRTTTKGVVVKPLLGVRAIEQWGLFGRMLSSLHFTYNESDSFLPAPLAYNLFGQVLPDPTGKGKDYGFSFNVGNKLVVRFNVYDDKQLNSRMDSLAARIRRLDTDSNASQDPFNLYTQAQLWVDTLQPGLSPDARDAAVSKYMGLPVSQVKLLTSGIPFADTANVQAKGKEIEINYNPSDFWTVKVSVAQQKAIDQGVEANDAAYMAARLPVWTTIVDPLRGTLWYDTNYGGSRPNADVFLNQLVFPSMKLFQANDGKSRSEVRQWRVNAMTSFRLAGLTDNRFLKNVALTGAVRWEDKGSIGYLADPNDPTSYDPDLPIYDKGHAYFDFGASYVTRAFSDKVRLRIQLNIRNAFEGGRLQPIAAFSDGTPSTYRIIDPRLIILTTTFDF